MQWQNQQMWLFVPQRGITIVLRCQYLDIRLRIIQLQPRFVGLSLLLEFFFLRGTILANVSKRSLRDETAERLSKILLRQPMMRIELQLRTPRNRNRGYSV